MNKNLYVDLLKKVLIDYYRVNQVEYWPVHSNFFTKTLESLFRFINKKDYTICHQRRYVLEERIEGLDNPRYADSMIGLKRLDNIEYCFYDIINNKIEGDFIETGVWRGGATIFMKALLKANNISNKVVWVADSFEGLPKPNKEKYDADKDSTFHLWSELAISLETVKANFEKYDLLDDKVKFLKGWFKDTLPIAPITSLALLRLDGDMYESTWDALINLYPKLSVGGYILIDDYGTVGACKKAVEDYRRQNNISEKIKFADKASVFWKKEKS